jgi:hypothetical protein
MARARRREGSAREGRGGENNRVSEEKFGDQVFRCVLVFVFVVRAASVCAHASVMCVRDNIPPTRTPSGVCHGKTSAHTRTHTRARAHTRTPKHRENESRE